MSANNRAWRAEVAGADGHSGAVGSGGDHGGGGAGALEVGAATVNAFDGVVQRVARELQVRPGVVHVPLPP